MPSDAELISEWESANSSPVAGIASNSPSDEDLLSHWQTQNPSAIDYIQGGLKGLAKGGLDLVTVPADLAFRSGIGIQNLLGGDIDPTGSYPSDYVNAGLDLMSGGRGNSTAETGTHLLSNLASIISLPSQAKTIANKVPLLPELLKSALGYGAEGAGIAALADPKSENLPATMAEGAALNTLLPAVLGMSKKPITGIKNLFSTAVKEDAAKTGALDLLSKIANPETIATKLDDFIVAEQTTPMIQRQSASYLPQYQRTAEIAGEPGLAALEETMRRSDMGVKSTSTLQDIEREAARSKIFDAANPNPMTDEAAGNAIREGLTANLDASRQGVGKFSEKAFLGGEELKSFPAKRVVSDALKQFTESGARSVTSEFKSLVNNFRALPPRVDLQTLQDYRSAFGKYAGGAGIGSTPQEKMTAEIAGRMRSAVDTSIETAVANGDLPAKQAKAWQDMIAARKAQGQTYESGIVGDLLKTNPFGAGFKVQSSEVARSALGTPEDARQLMTALGKQTTSKSALRSSLMSRIWDKSTNAMTGELNPTTFHRQLNVISGIDKEILLPSQIKALTKIGDDLASQATIKSNAYKASKGNSVTSEATSMIDMLQNAVREGSTGTLRSAIKNIKFIGPALDGLISIVSNPEQRQILLNKELAKFVMDPKYAKALLEHSSKVDPVILGEFGKGLSKAVTGMASAMDRHDQTQADIPTQLPQAPNKIRSLLGKTTGKPQGDINMDQIPKADVSPTKLDAIAQTHDLNLNSLDKAQIAVESAANPNAIGPTTKYGTAKGLMQLLDSTGKEWAKKLGIENFNPLDPKQNVKVGKAYRDFLIAKYDGDVKLGLAAYNYGPGNLDKLISKYGNSYDKIEAHLPQETSNYVDKILGGVVTA